MPGFVLRQEGDLQNPTSPLPLGEQTTHAQLVYWRREGNQTYLIATLGGGEKLLTGETSENGFHGEGFFDSVVWYRYRGFLLSPYNASSGTGDYIFHKGYETDPALGYSDPEQGRPHFFPELDFTFSGRPYVEARLPSNVHDGEDDPTESEIRVKTSCVWDYDRQGNRVGSTPTFTSNVARHVAFACRRAGLDVATEIDWPSWTDKFKAKCDEGIGWALGGGDGLNGEYYDELDFTTLVLRRIDQQVDFHWGQVSPVPPGHPVWQNVVGAIVGENGAWTQTAATGWGGSGAASTMAIPFGGTGSIKGILGRGTVNIGLCYADNPVTFSDLDYSWQLNYLSNIATARGAGGVLLATGFPCYPGDEFGLAVNGTTVTYLKNGVAQSVPGVAATTDALYGGIVGFHEGANLTSTSMDPSPASLSGEYAVKWTGYFQASETGDHNFYVNATDGVKLIVNGTTLIDDLVEGSLRERFGTIGLTANAGYTIELQYKRLVSDGQVTLSYSTDKISKQPIPKSQLFSTSGILGSGRAVLRFESDVVFDGMPWPQALDILMMRAPGVKWQRVNGKVTFLWANERQPVKRFIYETGIPFTVNPATDTCLCDDHGLSNGDLLRLNNITGTMPEGLAIRTTYYVRDVTTDTFKLSLTPGGAAVNIIDSGKGETMYTQRSNIVQNSVIAQRTDPLRKPNFLVVGYRDKDDDVFKQAFVDIQREDLIEANDGRPIDPGIQQIGVATASLAGRIGESLMRRSSDRDIEVQLKGQKSSHTVAKCDLIELVHPRGDWRLTPFQGHPDGPILLEVVTETFESTITTANEKSFIVRIWYPEYDDTAHGPLTGKPRGYVPSSFDKPPVVVNVALTAGVAATANGAQTRTIEGVALFSSTYKFNQQGHVWWRDPATKIAFTAASSIITADDHGYAENTPVMFESSGTLPAGLDASTTYFVRNVTTDTFQVSKMRGGSIVAITDSGSGNHSVAPFVMTDRLITPNANYQAAFSLPGATNGIYKIKVVTQSQTQQQLAFELHPTWQIEVLPPSPKDLTIIRPAGVDWAATWNAGVEGFYNPEVFVLRIRHPITNAIIRSMTIQTRDAVPCAWSYIDGNGDTSRVTISPDGTIETTIQPSVFLPGLRYESQPFYGDLEFEFETDDRNFYNAWLQPDYDWSSRVDFVVVGDECVVITADLDFPLEVGMAITFDPGDAPTNLIAKTRYYISEIRITPAVGFTPEWAWFKLAPAIGEDSMTLGSDPGGFDHNQFRVSPPAVSIFGGNGFYIGPDGDSSLVNPYTKRLLPRMLLSIKVRNGHAEYFVNGAFWKRSEMSTLPNVLTANISFWSSTEAQAILRARARLAKPRQFVYTSEMAAVDFEDAPIPSTLIFEVSQLIGETESVAISAEG